MNANQIAQSGVIFARILQYLLAGFAALIVAGAFFGNMGGLEFMMLGVFALVLLAFVGVVELIVVGPVQRRWSA